MKKLFAFALMAICGAISCNKFDDSAIWDKLNDHETRLAYLEEVCKKINADIINLQTIVTALETNDYIINASPLATGDGYTFIFKSGKSVVIYNGKDGVDGKDGFDGVDGVDGKDGITPTISVMKDVDGIYYWTVNNEWLIVNGQKVKASATDGKEGENGTNGTNGKDGMTPKFKIDEEYWFVSYDNGQSWEKLGKATGANGTNGMDGDNLFKNIALYDGYVVFVLNDGVDTTITLSFYSKDVLTVTVSDDYRLESALTLEQCRNVLHLKIRGNMTELDMKYLLAKMYVLEILDLSEAFYTSTYSYPVLNPFRDVYVNNTIREVSLSPFVEEWDIDYMVGLESIKIYPGFKEIGLIGGQTKCLPHLKKVYFTEGITSIPACPINVQAKVDFYLPSTLSEVSPYVFYENNAFNGGFRAKSVTIYANVPPAIAKETAFYSDKNRQGNIEVPLYVPESSIDLYKSANGWKQFVNIFPLK